MSDDDVIHVRLDSLEEFRREQVVLNKCINDSLHRIELSLNQSVAKACPLPGHCVVLENSVKAKWDGDKARFERMEKRLAENDDWHKVIEARMETKLDGLHSKISLIHKTVWGAAGGAAVFVVILPWIMEAIKALHR
jgi:hypothetical protein